MKIAIRKEPNGSLYFDKTVCQSGRFTLETLKKPPYNFTIVEVPEEYLTLCVAEDFDSETFEFNVEKYNTRLANENNTKELNQELETLLTWFEGYYRCQVEQYNRCQRTGDVYDKDIVALDKQANATQIRIREIKNILKID